MTKRTNLTAIGYVRVSVDEADKISPDVQKSTIEEYAARKGWDLTDVVIERGRSAGEGKRRPKFDRVREQIASGTIDALIVYRLDRATRFGARAKRLRSKAQAHEAIDAGLAEARELGLAVRLARTARRLSPSKRSAA